MGVSAGPAPIMGTGKFGLGSLKSGSSQPNTTGFLEPEQCNPGSDWRAGTTNVQQCAEQLGRISALAAEGLDWVSKAGDATVQARQQRRFRVVTVSRHQQSHLTIQARPAASWTPSACIFPGVSQSKIHLGGGAGWWPGSR